MDRYNRARMLDRPRTSAFGRIYSVAGGAANHPLVAFAADAGWLREDDSRSWMAPQCLIFERGYSRTGSAEHLRDWIDRDLANWRAEPNRASKPVLIAVETSQSPHLFRRIDELFRNDPNVQTVGYRLRTGDQNVTESMGEPSSGAHDVGGNWLTSWFNDRTPSEPPTDARMGRPYTPGKIAISFSQFRSEEAPGLGREAVRSSLSAAETLRAKAQRDADLTMALTADEAKAAAIMVAALAADQSSPPIKPPASGQSAWGWAPAPWGKPIRSRYTGVS